MTIGTYEKINEYSSVKISLASTDDIRNKSYGEVKKPETIIIVRTVQRRTDCFVKGFSVQSVIGNVFAGNIKE